jgi:kynurenine formamidase
MKNSIPGRRKFVAGAGLAALAATFGEVLTGREVRADDDSDVDKFVRAVQRAKIFDLSHLWDENSPIAGVNPSYAMALDATHANSRPNFDGKLSFTSEIQRWSGQHGAPSLDAIGHIGRNGKLFGGVDAVASTSDPRGIGRDTLATGAHLDIAHYPKELLVNRGVLLDVARHVAVMNKEKDKLKPLDGVAAIDADLLADTAHHQGVKIRRGDTILIRTGWGQYFSGNPKLYAGDTAAGVDLSGARYLVKQRARVVGNDTLTFERRPPLAGTPGGSDFEIFPVHQFLIPDNGVSIIENYFLEELSEAKEYEFLLVVPPLKIRGGTGSALRSFALVP